jgi:hypothetical protein
MTYLLQQEMQRTTMQQDMQLLQNKMEEMTLHLQNMHQLSQRYSQYHHQGVMSSNQSSSYTSLISSDLLPMTVPSINTNNNTMNSTVTSTYAGVPTVNPRESVSNREPSSSSQQQVPHNMMSLLTPNHSVHHTHMTPHRSAHSVNGANVNSFGLSFKGTSTTDL